MNSVEVRRELADALKLDLVGPSSRLGSPSEILPQAPSRWYLTGFLVPLDAEPDQKMDEDNTDAVDGPKRCGRSRRCDDAGTSLRPAELHAFLHGPQPSDWRHDQEAKDQRPLGRL